MSLPIIKEDLYQKVISDTLGRPFSVQWSDDGSVSIMTQEAVHIYTTVFRSASAYQCRWITVVKEATKNKTNQDNEKFDVHTFLQRKSLMNERPVNFVACGWCANTLFVGGLNLFSALLSNGSLLLFRPNSSSNSFQLAGDFSQSKVEMFGFELVSDISASFKSWMEHNRCETCKFQISNYAMIPHEASSSVTAVLTCGMFISLFRVTRDAVSGTVSTVCIGSHNMSERICPCSAAAASSSTSLSSSEMSRRISSLTVTKNSATSNSDVTQWFSIILGTSDGCVTKLSVTISPALSSTVDAKAGLEVEWTRSTTTNDHGELGAIDRVRIVQPNGSDGDAETVCVVQTNRLSVLSADGTQQMVKLPHMYDVTGWAALSNLSSSSSSSDLQITCSLDGAVCTWSPPVISSSSSSSSSGDISKKVVVSEEVSLHQGVFGVAADPLKLMIVYAHKLNASHENTREVQMNHALMRTRAALMWQLSPTLDNRWTDSVDQVSEVLHLVITRHGTRENRVSFASLPLAVLHSLDHVKRLSRNYASLDKSNTAQQSSINSTHSDDEEEEEDEEENCEDGVKTYKVVRAEARKPIEGFTLQNSTPKQRRAYDHMRALTDHISVFHGPTMNELVASVMDRLVDAAVYLSERKSSSEWTSFEEYSAATRIKVTAEMKHDMILRFPTDSSALLQKVALWRALHVTIHATHSYRGLPLSEAAQQLTRALKYAISVAISLDTVQRLLSVHRTAPVTSLLTDSHHMISTLRMLSSLDGFDCDDEAVMTQVEEVSRAGREALRGLFATSALCKDKGKEAVDTQFDAHCKQLLNEHCCVCESAISQFQSAESRGQVNDSMLCDECGLRTERCCFTHLPLYQPVKNRTKNNNTGSVFPIAGAAAPVVDDICVFDGPILQCPCCSSATRRVNNVARHSWVTDLLSPLCPYCSVQLVQI